MTSDVAGQVGAFAEERLRRLPPDKAAAVIRQLEAMGSPLDVESERSEPATETRLAPLLPFPSGPPSPAPSPRGFLDYVHAMWPGFIEGRHHAAIAGAFERILNGTLKRLVINIAPRHGKSELTSVFLPSWFMGCRPDTKIICATHTEKLSVSFGRRVRNLMREEEYAEWFPDPKARISKDSKAAGQWTTNGGGQYYAIGTEGRLAGRGANLLVIDDPHSEQDVVKGMGDEHFDKAYEWYMTGPRQRLQPGGAIVINQTRWGKRDLTGKLLAMAASDPRADQWEVLNFPALLPDGSSLFPEFWPAHELEALKRNLPAQRWQAQYQQNPVSADASVVKAEWWQRWDRRPPRCTFVVSAWDTSFGESKRADPSANTLWGLFAPNKEPGMPKTAPSFGIILLDAFEGRLPFPDLKRKVFELYRQHKPDCLSIEAKTAGAPLIQELTRMGLPVWRDGSAHSGNDKLTRLNGVSDLFRSGLVYYLPSVVLAPDVMNQFASYPDTEHDDLMDTGIQALERFRAGGWVEMESDWTADPEDDPDLVVSGPRPPRGGWY